MLLPTVQPGRHMHCCETEHSPEHLWNEENVKDLGIRAAGTEDHKIITRIYKISSENKSSSSQKYKSTKTTMIFNI